MRRSTPHRSRSRRPSTVRTASGGSAACRSWRKICKDGAELSIGSRSNRPKLRNGPASWTVYAGSRSNYPTSALALRSNARIRPTISPPVTESTRRSPERRAISGSIRRDSKVVWSAGVRSEPTRLEPTYSKPLNGPARAAVSLSVCGWRRCILPLRKLTMDPAEWMASGPQSLLDEPAARPMCRASPLQTVLRRQVMVDSHC